MALYHTHNSSTISPYFYRIQKTEKLPVKNKLSIALNSLCIKLNEISMRYDGKNENKVKKTISDELENFDDILFEDSSLYQCFFSDYLNTNSKRMGEFREQIKNASKKIKNLDFKGLTPEQVLQKISVLFQDELKDDALTIAEEMNNDFEKQKQEVIQARVEQWKKFRLLVGEDSTLANLTLHQFVNLVQNTPSLMNVSPEEIKGIDTVEFEKLARTDNISLKSECSYEHCCVDKDTFDMKDVKEVAEFAKENNQELHLDTIIESTSYAEMPALKTYTAQELKESFALYLDALNSSCETISSCTFMSNLIYDPTYTTDLSDYMNKPMEEVQHTEATVKVPYTMQIDNQPNYTFEDSEIETVSSTSVELKPCIWQPLGDDWYIQLLEIGKEKMPNTKFYYSESGLDNPEKAKKTFDFLNKIREYEIKKEKETGKDCTLLDGINIQYSIKADEPTIQGLDKSMEVLSKVIETAQAGFVESEQPVRFSDIKVEKVTVDESGNQIQEDVAIERQKQAYTAISNVVTTYNDAIDTVELAGLTDGITIDGSQLSFNYELDSSPYLFNENGEPKEELGATELLQSFEGLSEEEKKKIILSKTSYSPEYVS